MTLKIAEFILWEGSYLVSQVRMGPGALDAYKCTCDHIIKHIHGVLCELCNKGHQFTMKYSLRVNRRFKTTKQTEDSKRQLPWNALHDYTGSFHFIPVWRLNA